MSAASLGLTGRSYSSQGIERGIAPRQTLSLLIKYPSRGERGSSACSDRYSNRGRLLPSWRYSIVRIKTVEPISCLCSNCGREPMPQPRAKPRKPAQVGFKPAEVPSLLQKGALMAAGYYFDSSLANCVKSS